MASALIKPNSISTKIGGTTRGIPVNDYDRYAADYTEQKLIDKKNALLKARKLAMSEKATLMKNAANTNAGPQLHNHPIAKLGKNALGSVSSVMIKLKAVSTSLRLGAIMMNWYLYGQLPLYLFGLAFLLLAVMNPFSLLVGVIEGLTNVNIAPGIGIFGGVSVGFNALITGFSWVFLVFAVISYYFSGIKCLSGSKSEIKLILFYVAVIGYGATFFQFLPWAIFWLYYVGRNPE